MTVADLLGLPREVLPRFVEKVAKAFVYGLWRLERDHGRGVRLRALRLRHRWRKADVPRLLRLPGWASHATSLRINKLLKDEKFARGRGVVSLSMRLPEKIFGVWDFANRLWGSDTPAHERVALYKKTRWWPYFVEAAYRGELERVSSAAAAQENVAKAASISPAEVHRLCQQVRDERGDSPPDDRDCPPTTAAALKQHLEKGPSL
jgi:hypothetical protein